ncbi:putative adhesin [Tropicimonas sp. S265A]|uniref:putative adhesin n=1 Tax=Tropicimonas sp. S265A TaxID=3415134 RepID=UPI003C7ADEE7
MVKKVFLSGHGGWKPESGYTRLPKGCKIHFYTDFAKNLITGMEYQILRGDYTDIQHSVDEYMQCPDLRLSSQDEKWTKRSETELAKRNDPDCSIMIAPAGGATLSELFQSWTKGNSGEVEFHWMACQTLGLKQVGGRSHGLNAGDFSHSDKAKARYRIKSNGKGKYMWMTDDGKIVA